MSVLSVGYCTIDHYGVVDRFLDPGLEREMSTFSVQGGGAAATSTVVLGRWGVETRFCGAVGDDARADTIDATLADEGIDTSPLVRQSDAVSQFAFTILEESSGDKQRLYTRGSVEPLDATEADALEVEAHDLLLVDGLEPALQTELARRATRADIPVLLHASGMDPEAEELVEYADYLIASERFATRFTGLGELDSLCRALLERETRAVVVTLGRDGVVGAWNDGIQCRTEAYEVDVVDTSGAGDVFAGAFAYGMYDDRPIEQTVRLANVAGALSCRGIGPRSAIPTWDELRTHLDS
jgi:sugar/nucleoside kinase (ribokinase family)